MDGVVVADQGVDADGGDEADRAGDGQGLPEVAGGGGAPGAGGDEKADVEHAATEAGAVVGDQGDEARVESVEAGGGGVHVLEVLGHEDDGDADEGDGEAGGEHGGGGGVHEVAGGGGAVGAPL